MRFKALIDFSSREFAGSHYVAGLTYAIREGNSKLADMASRWLDAQRFVPIEDFTVAGLQFTAGKESYVLADDDLKVLIDQRVQQGKAEYTGTGIISFNFDDTGPAVTGGVVKSNQGA